MSFAEEFTLQRKLLHLSQEKLAEQIGVSRAYISLIENGKRLPGKKLFPKIAFALQIKKHAVVSWYLQDVHSKLLEAEE